MTKYYALAITTKYWRPATDYLNEIIEAVASRIDNGDFVVVSEKAISTALGNIADESRIRPSLNAKLIAKLWMQFIWGYFLGCASAILGSACCRDYERTLLTQAAAISN